MAHYAIIKDSKVVNIIVGDEKFAQHHRTTYPELVMVEIPRHPQIGDGYDAATGMFLERALEPHGLPEPTE